MQSGLRNLDAEQIGKIMTKRLVRSLPGKWSQFLFRRSTRNPYNQAVASLVIPR